MCPHASGVMPIGARAFSYTFRCTCAAISSSCGSTMLPFFQVWGHFWNSLLSVLLVFGEVGASLVSIWDQSGISLTLSQSLCLHQGKFKNEMCPHPSGVVPIGARGFLTHFGAPVLQYRPVVVQQWCQLFQVWGHFWNSLLSILLVFGEFGVSLV